MNINLTDHRQAHRQRLKRVTAIRCGWAVLLGLVLAAAYAWWIHKQRQSWSIAWALTQNESRQLQTQQAAWDQHTQAWLVWQAQGQAWWHLGYESQKPLRIWHWLGTATAHGVRWTQWQQEGQRWTVVGEANRLIDVQQWVVSGVYKPIPVDREVSVSQTHQNGKGRIGFAVTWEELP